MQITFGYPRRGLTGQFNTFRLGLGLSTLTPGQGVELVDSRSKKLLKRAIVVSVHTGKLPDMATAHAHAAHNWRDHPAEQRAELLTRSLTKRYPPGRVKPDSVVTVIYLQELPDGMEPHDQRSPPGA